MTLVPAEHKVPSPPSENSSNRANLPRVLVPVAPGAKGGPTLHPTTPHPQEPGKSAGPLGRALRLRGNEKEWLVGAKGGSWGDESGGRGGRVLT